MSEKMVTTGGGFVSAHAGVQLLVESLAAKLDMNAALKSRFCGQREFERRRAATIRVMRQCAEREAL